jgi:hypothetical protein
MRRKFNLFNEIFIGGAAGQFEELSTKRVIGLLATLLIFFSGLADL